MLANTAPALSRQAESPEAGYTIHYQRDVWADRPLADPCTCRHPGMMACPVGLEVVRTKPGASEIALYCDICMDCGADRTGKVGLADGLTLAMAEMGHAFPFWQRINELVAHRADDLAGCLVPLWMAGPLGLSRRQIGEYAHTARVHRAAGYMAARMARYAAITN